MRFLPQALLLIGVSALFFCGWGMKSDRGRHTFDEMAGMIPMAACVLGVVLVLCGVL